MQFIKNLFSTFSAKPVLALKFTLPATNSKNIEALDKEAFLAKDVSSMEALKTFQACSKSVNKAALNFVKRKKITEDLYRVFIARVIPEAENQAKGGGIPDTESKKVVLGAMLDGLQELIVSAQFLYQSVYGSRSRERKANLFYSATLLLDLLVLKQWLLSIQYRSLSEQDWKLLNTVFFSASHELDDKQSINASGIDLGFCPADTLLGLYAHLQLIPMLDMMGWPTHLHRFAGQYLASIELPMETKALSEELPRYSLVTDCYDFTAARVFKNYVRIGSLPMPPLALDYQRLVGAIKQDHGGILQAKADGREGVIPARLAKLSDVEQFTVASLLAKAVFDVLDMKIVGHEHRVEDFRIYSGLVSVFSLLNNIFKYSGEERLADMLAKRSSIIAEDHVATIETAWFVLFQNEKMIRMSTQESRFTTDMRVGALLAYGTGDDTLARPRLSMVTRIQRGIGKTIIDLRRLASYAEPVKLKIGQGQVRPALLIFDKEIGGWGLVFQPNGFIATAKELVMVRNAEEFPFENKGMLHGTMDFMLILTSLQSGTLIAGDKPEYPDKK